MVTAHHKPRRRVSGGRAKRLSNHRMKTGNEAVQGGLLGGRYCPLSKIDMDKINTAALTHFQTQIFSIPFITVFWSLLWMVIA